jgi:hypothetical protein
MSDNGLVDWSADGTTFLPLRGRLGATSLATPDELALVLCLGVH